MLKATVAIQVIAWYDTSRTCDDMDITRHYALSTVVTPTESTKSLLNHTTKIIRTITVDGICSLHP